MLFRKHSMQEGKHATLQSKFLSKTICHWFKLNSLKEQKLIRGKNVSHSNTLKTVQQSRQSTVPNVVLGKGGVDVSERYMYDKVRRLDNWGSIPCRGKGFFL
jgi:hypothetical protein